MRCLQLKTKVLVAEISGKRPGDSQKRPTEKFSFDFDKVIISNNSEGYETGWPIINVPDDYRDWYKDHCKMSDKAYFAPMNRSYAIKYARDNGYDYLVQLDDNILTFNIKYMLRPDNGVTAKFATNSQTPGREHIQNDMINYMIEVLKNTNAGMVGMVPESGAVPRDHWLRERYVYSAFVLDLHRIPAYFQGDFEDDIEYRLKLKQMKVPSLEVCCFWYGKTSQGNGKREDTSGNRQAYIDAGINRGEHMSKLYGDYYQRGWSDRGSGVRRTGKVNFRHKLKPFKVGVRIKNVDYLKRYVMALFEKYATNKTDSFDIVLAKPKFYFGIVDKSYDEFSTLDKIITVILKYDLTVTNPKSSGIDYTVITQNENDVVKVTEELNSIKGVSLLKGVK